MFDPEQKAPWWYPGGNQRAYQAQTLLDEAAQAIAG